MGKFCQSLTELSARDKSIFSFTDDNLSNCQRILTKLGTYIDMKYIWIRIANEQISSMFDSYLPMTRLAGYYSLTFLFWRCKKNINAFLNDKKEHLT